MGRPGFIRLDNAFWDSRHLLVLDDAMDITPDKESDGATNGTENKDANAADGANGVKEGYDASNTAPYRQLLREYGPAIGLLKTGALDRAYLGRTAFNPFALLRVGWEAMTACVGFLFYPYF